MSNFERTRNYELAEDCSIGAMEMKRRDPTQPRLGRWALGVYRWASLYGSSYTRALAVLIILLFVVFGPAFALPWAGLERAATEEIMSPKASGWLQVAEDFQAAMLHSLEVATFQRNRLHVPSGYFGRVVSALETVVIPAQLALLLLARRRRFRR